MTVAPPPATLGEISLTVNGTERRVVRGRSVAELVAELAPDARMVAVERNGEIVPRAKWAETGLESGDRLELVRFVQGG